MLKKFFYSSVIIIGFAFYVVYQNKLVAKPTLLTSSSDSNRQPISSNEPTLVLNEQYSGSTNSPASVSKTVSVETPVSIPTKPTGQYKDGSYTGVVSDAYYGNIQVKAIISGGKIIDVIFLQYPNDRANSVRVNTQAIPILKEEAIAAQNANVDVVTGATESSHAFIQSLESALAQAKP